MPIEKPTGPGGTNGYRILLIDDEENVLESYSDVFKRWGYQVTGMQTAQEAIALLAKEDFDLIITDLRMPDKGGIDVIKTIRKEHPFIPVLVMTGVPSIQTAVHALKEGAIDYVQKPFSISEIRKRVDEALMESCTSKMIIKVLEGISQRVENMLTIVSGNILLLLKQGGKQHRELLHDLQAVEEHASMISNLVRECQSLNMARDRDEASES